MNVSIAQIHYDRPQPKLPIWKMPRSWSLSERVKGAIETLAADKLTTGATAKRIKWSQTVVCKYLMSFSKYGTQKMSGKPKRYSDATHRHVISEASATGHGYNRVRKDLQLVLSRATGLRLLQNDHKLEYHKMQRSFFLINGHKKKKVESATVLAQ